MPKNLDPLSRPNKADFDYARTSPAGSGKARYMRRHLAEFAGRMAVGAQPLRLPSQAVECAVRGEGQFHLAAELFLQVAGWTRFHFPHAQLLLGPGDVLLLPPRLLHAERVGAGADGIPFSNIVIYADDAQLTCHVAEEAGSGTPHIAYLEVSRHAQAQRIHDWLDDAARLGVPSSDLGLAQARALVAAATAGVLRALDDSGVDTQTEAPLVAHARLLVQNQLGDQQLSVGSVAAQLGCTADYLSHVFRQSTGERLAAYMNRLRMARAARLLRETTLAGKEVAWLCGFATPSYFIRTFQQHYNMTPKAWRADTQRLAADG